MTWLQNILAALARIFVPKSPPAPPVPPPVVPPPPEPAPMPPTPPAPAILLFDTQSHAYHSTRVLCDDAELSVEGKNLICACIYQESRFHNSAVNHNKAANGATLSTDWGLCQVNDYYHIGLTKDFPNVPYVLDNPDKVVAWMIQMYKTGRLSQWVSYSSGAYKQWLLPSSPMWMLATR